MIDDDTTRCKAIRTPCFLQSWGLCSHRKQVNLRRAGDTNSRDGADQEDFGRAAHRCGKVAVFSWAKKNPSEGERNAYQMGQDLAARLGKAFDAYKGKRFKPDEVIYFKVPWKITHHRWTWTAPVTIRKKVDELRIIMAAREG